LKAKKRKPSESLPVKNAPPPKKPALGTPSSSKPVVVKKETKPVAPAVKDAKLDTSFFSAPKPKPKLPSFKKAPPAPVSVKKEPDPNVAQPSAIDPFQEALKFMAKNRKEIPLVSTPPPTTQPSAANTPPPGLAKNGKKKKSVTWAPEGQLESVRLIEKAIYDDDPVDVSCSLLSCFLYCTLICLVPFHVLPFSRVYIQLTVCATWIGGRELRCMHTCLKKRLIGPSHF